MENPIGISGFEFVEFSAPDPAPLRRLFLDMGFSLTKRHARKAIELFEQNEIRFLLNAEPGSHAERFCRLHGPCASSMCWRVQDKPDVAARAAASRGARLADGDYNLEDGMLPALDGIGGSLIYLRSENDADFYERLGFVDLPESEKILQPGYGFLRMDHLTNNVEHGTMSKWASFYKDIFGFTEMRYFDIRGMKTGLQSYALRSPCKTFAIPINEAKEERSQINEYLERYKGPGIQHIALLTPSLVKSMELMEGKVPTLDIEPGYYSEAFERTPTLAEDKDAIQRQSILVDGDDHGHLLQIFTKDAIGPIFFEFIERHNHQSFGEGNFGALFKSIERDQQRRGYL